MESFYISFSGETLPGADLDAAKRGLVSFFNLDPSMKADHFFSGETIILRRNLDRETAKKVYVALRKLGLVTKIHLEGGPVGGAAGARARQPEGTAGVRAAGGKAAANPRRVAKATPAKKPAPAAPRRRRQPGAPNLFDVRLARGALEEAQQQEDHFSHAARLGAVIITLALVLVALRFWIAGFDTPPDGLGTVVVDAAERPAVVVNDQLLRHDRAGNPGELADVSGLGISPSTSLDFFSNGDLLVKLPPAGENVPTWLHGVLEIQPKPAHLARCKLRTEECRPFLTPVNEVAFVVNRRTDNVLVADVAGNRLLKLSGQGTVLAMRALALESPVSLSVHDGLIYLTRDDAVLALDSSDRDFGKGLNSFTLTAEGAQATGHIFPAATAWLGGHWFVRMQSRDGSTAGLYRFDEAWQPVDPVALPDGAHPGDPVRWADKLLVPDARNEVVYRVAADAGVEAPFSPEALSDALSKRREALDFSGSLQAIVLLLMFFLALALYSFATIKSLQGKVYKALSTTDEKSFDIASDAITWLDPAPNARRRIQWVLYGLAAAAVILLITALLARLDLGLVLALLLLIGGAAGYFYAMYLSWGCHLGLLGEELVAVDHNSTYRVGKGPKIQYVNNYVMIDDVIVYLGNRLLPQFVENTLQETFQPVVFRGIRVDRTTLRLKLINSRHPMFYGVLGLLLCSAAALALVLLA